MKEPVPTVEVFTEVAPQYEFLNSLMTGGLDRKWRKSLLDQSESALGYSPTSVLDLATGTGDVARLSANRWPNAKITGTDPTPAMLNVARTKSSAHGAPKPTQDIEWREGVAELITLPGNSLDLITIAFGFRNVPAQNRERALMECLRVLKPGGVMSILELGLPEGKLLRAPYGFLLSKGMPLLASFFAPRAPYDYLAQSIHDFPSPGENKKLLSRAGFIPFAPRALSAGMCWLYIGKKPASELPH
jgi:demethylmenaquinone methyltransferase / 2-methoxy-6-polyprenyl-1,4-benzoquinol methylase